MFIINFLSSNHFHSLNSNFDGNFAFAAGINELLLQSVDGKEIPLPALPIEWRKGGYIKGLKLKNNRTIEIGWKDDKIIKFNINNI